MTEDRLKGEQHGAVRMQQLLDDPLLRPLLDDLCNWLTRILNIDIHALNFTEPLQTGTDLCRLADAISKTAAENGMECHTLKYKAGAKPGSFQARCNIEAFLMWARALGVRETCLFETIDLVELKFLRNVLICLLEISRKVDVYGVEPPELVKLEKTTNIPWMELIKLSMRRKSTGNVMSVTDITNTVGQIQKEAEQEAEDHQDSMGALSHFRKWREFTLSSIRSRAEDEQDVYLEVDGGMAEEEMLEVIKHEAVNEPVKEFSLEYDDYEDLSNQTPDAMSSLEAEGYHSTDDMMVIVSVEETPPSVSSDHMANIKHTDTRTPKSAVDMMVHTENNPSHGSLSLTYSVGTLKNTTSPITTVIMEEQQSPYPTTTDRVLKVEDKASIDADTKLDVEYLKENTEDNDERQLPTEVMAEMEDVEEPDISVVSDNLLLVHQEFIDPVHITPDKYIDTKIPTEESNLFPNIETFDVSPVNSMRTQTDILVYSESKVSDSHTSDSDVQDIELKSDPSAALSLPQSHAYSNDGYESSGTTQPQQTIHIVTKLQHDVIIAQKTASGSDLGNFETPGSVSDEDKESFQTPRECVSHDTEPANYYTDRGQMTGASTNDSTDRCQGTDASTNDSTDRGQMAGVPTNDSTEDNVTWCFALCYPVILEDKGSKSQLSDHQLEELHTKRSRFLILGIILTIIGASLAIADGVFGAIYSSNFAVDTLSTVLFFIILAASLICLIVGISLISLWIVQHYKLKNHKSKLLDYEHNPSYGTITSKLQ